MPTPFIMPKVDMDQEKATIISWNKSEGDEVKQDETVLVVETEKVAIDVPAPATGTLVDIRFKAGDVVPIATTIAYILGKGETINDIPGRTAGTTTPAAKAVETAKVAATPTPVALRAAQELGVNINEVPSHGGRISREDVEAYAKSLQGEVVAAGEPTEAGKIAATPAARRLAQEAGIALENLTGSGPRGRIQAQDVVARPAAQPMAKPSVQPVAQPATTSVGERSAKVIPMTNMRQKIAERLQASFRDVPHIFLTAEADVTRLEEARKRLNDIAAKQSGSKVSLTAMLVKVIAWALERNPYMNASLIDQSIYLWEDVNIGVATALDEGLIVPVIRNANHLSISQISEKIVDLSKRAREGKLTLSEVKGGTFTISNLGMFGIPQFNAVINPPESGILATGAVVRKPVVVDEYDTIEVRPIITMTLSGDHRVVDGAVAARFMRDLVQAIEYPEIML